MQQKPNAIPPAPANDRSVVSDTASVWRYRRVYWPRRLRQFAARTPLRWKTRLNWWLIHGPMRTGTSYMACAAATCARLTVSDWGLGDMLKLVPDHPHIRLDRARALRDISRNILDNADAGGGTTLDLVFKQASLYRPEYERLVEMWGEPSRTVFCFREPEGYMASAARKFTDSHTIGHLQAEYVTLLRNYPRIGGDRFEYSETLRTRDYIEFLRPLPIRAECIRPFAFRGERAPELVTDEMRETFRRFRQDNLEP